MENNKVHYKMYKSGKKWLIASIISTGVGLIGVTSIKSVSANADTTVNQNVVNQNSVSQSNSSESNLSETSSNSNSSSASASSQATSSVTSSNSSASNEPSSNKSNEAQSSSANSSVSNDIKTVKLSTTTGNDNFKANLKSKQTKSVTMKAQSNNAVQKHVSVTNDLSKKSFNKKPTTISTNIKKVNGKYQYINSQGQSQKNVIVTDENNAAYFDSNGNYVNLSKQLPKADLKTIKNKFLNNNAIYSLNKKNIKTINGFLTANSWYRPKQILKNGKTWTKSTSKDFRPLLMTWWPDKQTQVNYLNYMNKNGLGNRSYSTKNNVNTLLKGTQKVQANIEKKITKNNGNTNWLKTTIQSFVKTQDQWNINSEAKWGYDGFQGGNLKYGNNKLTPDANSNYRLLNRGAGSEFLLESDVDNSNPVVQAENLNWVHYMLHTGSIINNDSSANFDGVRLDAVGDMDTDFLRLTNQYLRDAYKTNQSDNNANNHISIIESGANPTYTGQNELVIDNALIGNMTSAFGNQPGDRPGPNNIISGSFINHANADGSQTVTPNYSFIHSHDTGVQEKLVQIIVDKIDKNGGFQSSPETFRKALQYYYQDMDSTNKTYTYYNMPTLYSLLLTNKGTVPRVYYGDMYQDDGQYMQNKTINYDDISSLLQARPKYVAGGQSMQSSDYGQILTSVRYGKGANNSTDSGNDLTRNSGIAVVASNNKSLEATNVSINMGAAHKNQAYRPLILSTDNGTQTFNTDDDAKNNVIYTDSNGNLNLNNNQVKGYSNPQVSGYLSVWVPVGASENQDVRTAASNDNHNDGNALHQNDALDSNVIYESFSNMQQNPTSSDNTLLSKLAQNANQLKQWGITSVEFPPLYKPAKGNDFLDEGIQNGYAFSDRYDLGLSGATKYGTYDQLANALKSIHAQGIQGMTDIVGNQLYDLNKPDVVSATRTNSNGDATNTSTISNDLYYALAKSTGKDYQAKYGGEFLSQLKKDYPDLFTTKQQSTGNVIDASIKLKQWSAKYLNGSNLQGSGAQYILRNAGNNQYFTLGNQGVHLPNQLLGKVTQTGWVKNKNGKLNYYTYSGQKAQGANMSIDNNNYTFDNKGNLVIGQYNVDNRNYLSISNGQQVTNTFVWHKGKLSFYDKNGIKVTNGFAEDPNHQGTFYYFDKRGNALVGSHVVDGAHLFFNKDGIQAKGQIAVDKNGYSHYYDANDGKQVANQDVTINGKIYHADANGNLNIPVQKS